MSMDREAEVQRLDLADRHIAERRLALEQLRASSQGVQEAERLLKSIK